MGGRKHKRSVEPKKAGDKRRSAVKELAFAEIRRLVVLGQVDNPPLPRRVQQWGQDKGLLPQPRTQDEDVSQMRKLRMWVSECLNSPPEHDKVDEAVLRELKSWIESRVIDGGRILRGGN
jgi:hypothetical protein